MYKKKKMDRKYKFLIILTVLVLIVAFIINVTVTSRNLNPFEKVVKDIGLSVSSVIYKPVKFVKSKINESKEKHNIYKKYEDLLKKYNSINFNESRIDELEKEISELKKLLDIKETFAEYDVTNASVINRSVDYWDDTITIDKGTTSGVKKDMAVITSEGLIGKVISSSYFYSTVRLLTSDNLGQKVSVKIQINDEKYVYGLLSKYDNKNKILEIEGISENVDVPDNAVVTTTGMSSIFPSGIIIGYTKGTKKDNFDLTMVVEVEPASNFDDLEFVTVLKREGSSE